MTFMKTISTLLFELLFCARSFGQSFAKQREPMLSFLFGVTRPYIDDHAFDNWRMQNYNIQRGHIGGNLDVTGIKNNSDFGHPLIRSARF
jgi:hypothetical protein